MKEEEEIIDINYTAIYNILYKEIWTIFIITTVMTIIGLSYSFSLKEEFISEGKILPEITSKGSSIGQIAGLAALAGVDLNNSTGGDVIRPDLYPQVLGSTPFFLGLLKEKIRNKYNKEILFSDFYNKEILNGKVKKEEQILNYPTSRNYLVLDIQTEKTIIDLKKRVICTYDKKTGEITISAKMPDPVVAANVSSYSMDYLKDYLVQYRTEKLNRDLKFLEDRLLKARSKYFNYQSKKANYNDLMPKGTLRFESSDLQRERIDVEYKTSSSFYNSLMQKYEEAKLKIQQETPVYKVLEPPVVPNRKMEPKRLIISIGFFTIGLFIALAFSFFKNRNYTQILNK